MLSQVLVFKHCPRHWRQLRRSCCMCLAILVPTALRHQVMIFSTSTLWTYFWSLYWAYFWPGLKRRYNLQDFNETHNRNSSSSPLKLPGQIGLKIEFRCLGCVTKCYPWCFFGLAVLVWRSSDRCSFVFLGSCPRAIWQEQFWIRQSWNEKEAKQAPRIPVQFRNGEFLQSKKTLKCLIK